MILQGLATWNPSFTSAIQTELETRDEEFTLFNFSNVDSNNYPSTRNVVLRGFLFDEPKTNVLIFTTDKRSSKYKDLLINPRFDACFYFSKMRKQFRFKGTVRMISDEIIPNIRYDLNYSDSYAGFNDHGVTNRGLDDEVLTGGIQQLSISPDTSSIADEEQSLVSQYLSQQNLKETPCPISEPLHYRLFSPKFVKSFEDSSASLTELAHSHEMGKSDDISVTPTAEEWNNERLRVWNAMSRNMKKTFKKPLPGSPLTEENRRKLDAINRGVDGNNSSTGYENFVVVCLFVELVDEVVIGGSGYDRRYLYRKTNQNTWKEYEVCP